MQQGECWTHWTHWECWSPAFFGSDSHAEWWSTLTSFSLGLACIAATCTQRFLAFLHNFRGPYGSVGMQGNSHGLITQFGACDAAAKRLHLPQSACGFSVASWANCQLPTAGCRLLVVVRGAIAVACDYVPRLLPLITKPHNKQVTGPSWHSSILCLSLGHKWSQICLRSSNDASRLTAHSQFFASLELCI